MSNGKTLSSTNDDRLHQSHKNSNIFSFHSIKGILINAKCVAAITFRCIVIKVVITVVDFQRIKILEFLKQIKTKRHKNKTTKLKMTYRKNIFQTSYPIKRNDKAFIKIRKINSSHKRILKMKFYFSNNKIF